MIKIKKLLTSLAALGLVASTSSMVVSCGPSFSSLRNRIIDNTVYKTTFSNNIQNWNMAATMQSADFKILSNIQDTLMTYEGSSDLLNPVPLLADAKQDKNKWIITVNKDASWYEFGTGKYIRHITANDILNTAKYSLNKHNGSELASDWRTFVKGADKITQDDIDKDDWSKLEATAKGDTLTLALNQDAPYFKTVLTTGSFAPTPDEALKMGYDYGRGINYNKTLLSGPYYVDSFKNSYQLVLKRNSSYKEKSAGTVNTIKYMFSSSGDVANTRRLWETGDITEAPVVPSDQYGYKHYVDKFDGLEKVNNNLIGSKYLWFNFSRQHKDNDIRQDDLDSNKALSFNSVRTLIAYAMNRATLVKYFAGSDEAVNDFIANTFNPSGYLKIGDKDYTESITDKTGNSAYYKNDELLKSAGANNLNELIKNINSDLGNKKVTLTFLTSGVNAKTFNPYIKKMITEFNDIENNPIRIIEQPTADDAAYQQAQIDGNFSMFITGETPTYIDPMSFLVNLESNGPMALYDGMSRLFNQDGTIKADAETKYHVDKSLLDEISNYTNELNENNKLTSDRNAAFAKTEKKILFSDKTIIPLYKPNGKYTYNLTYIDPNSRPNHGFGYQDYRFDKVKLFKTVQELINSGELNNNSKNKDAIVKQK